MCEEPFVWAIIRSIKLYSRFFSIAVSADRFRCKLSFTFSFIEHFLSLIKKAFSFISIPTKKYSLDSVIFQPINHEKI